MTREAFAGLVDVSRETLDRLQTFLDLLETWQEKINLVGQSTLADPWRRHMLDSAQLWPLVLAHANEKNRDRLTLVDFGSGAGFPGLVLGILAAGSPAPIAVNVHLVESTGRKAAFLAEAARRTGARARVHRGRIEALDPAAVTGPGRADIVTARALAPLDQLLDLAGGWLGEGGIALFPKGRDATRELTAARKTRKLDVETVPTLSDPHGVILRIREGWSERD